MPDVPSLRRRRSPSQLLPKEIEIQNDLALAEGIRLSEEHMLTDDAEQRARRQRLFHNLATYGYTYEEVPRDGNCQFAAVLQQAGVSFEYHVLFRKLVILWMDRNSELYSQSVPMPWDEYLQTMNVVGAWGDYSTMRPMLDMLGVSATIISDAVDVNHAMIELLPLFQDESDVGRKRAMFFDLAQSIDSDLGDLFMNLRTTFHSRRLNFGFFFELHYGVAVPLDRSIDVRTPSSDVYNMVPHWHHPVSTSSSSQIMRSDI